MPNGNAATVAGAVHGIPVNDNNNNYLSGYVVNGGAITDQQLPTAADGGVSALSGDNVVDKRKHSSGSTSEIIKSLPTPTHRSASPFRVEDGGISTPTTSSSQKEAEAEEEGIIRRAACTERQQLEINSEMITKGGMVVNEAAATLNSPLPFSDLESDGEDEKDEWVERLLKFNNSDRKMSIDIPSPSFGFGQDRRTSSSIEVTRKCVAVEKIGEGNKNQPQLQQQYQQQQPCIENKVDYMIIVCKNAVLYTKRLSKKLSTIPEGKNLTTALQDTFRDLTKQRDKILAVYNTYEVSRSGDKLGLTLAEAIELLGQVEKASVLFGKKSKLAKSREI